MKKKTRIVSTLAGPVFQQRPTTENEPPRFPPYALDPDATCAEFPEVLVSDAERLELALHRVLDEDEAVDAVQVVLEAGWRPLPGSSPTDGLPPIGVEGALWVAAIDRVPIEDRTEWVATMMKRVAEIDAGRAGSSPTSSTEESVDE